MGILALDCLDWRSNLPHYLNAWRLARSREAESWCRAGHAPSTRKVIIVGTHCNSNLVIVIYTCMLIGRYTIPHPNLVLLCTSSPI